MSRPILLITAACFGAVLHAQYTATVKTNVTTVENPSWRKWSDRECVINYPANWTHEGNLGTNAVASFFAPADPSGGFRERVLLSSLPAAGKPATDLVRELEADARILLPDAEVTAVSTTGDGVTMELKGLSEGRPVRMKRELSVHEDRAWVLTYMAAPERYEEALYMANAMFLSFAVR